MAISRLARDEAWYKLISIEEQYYRAMAIFCLSEEGIVAPSKDEINEKISYLSHISPKKTALISKPLTSNELKCLYYASCGKEVKEIAILLKKTESSIIKIRATACHKLRCEKVNEAIFVATQLGYLPVKAGKLASQTIEIEEIEHTSI
ncbi:helix-turn-helix transcriptional regulator [Rickettsiella massiliensis]|uniref:helix-turn-helix transcriptional regulator n=1 Tax=Rickettsiella massiliensis TaxID=676517 RepID=UPI000299E0EA|nr:helix-turn-helix transcriptional regulator [Rickettsiella massiliensis]